MGRAPCCDKQRVRRGQWSAEEDAVLKSYMELNGTVTTSWLSLPQKIGLNRCGKSCRLRWLNYLRPDIKHGGFTKEEDDIISHLYFTIGSRWSIIAKKLQGRTDNDIKNYWNTKLQRKFVGKRKKSCRHRISYEGFLETHEDYNHIDYIDPAESSNPNRTTFSITNYHLMPSNWTHSTPQLHSNPTTTTSWPQFNMINFSAKSVHCDRQQQQYGFMNLHRHPIINDVGSSSSLQQHNMNNNHNIGNVTLDTILREMEAVLLANDSPSLEIDAPDLLPCNYDEKNMIDNNTMDVASNDARNGESLGSLDWGDMTSLISSSLDEFSDYINWEEISLQEAFKSP